MIKINFIIIIIRQFCWTRIIRILKFYDSIKRKNILIDNIELQKKLIMTINVTKKLILMTIKILRVLLVLVAVLFTALNYNFQDFFWFGIIGGLFHYLIHTSMVVVTCGSFFYFFIICYYLNLKFKAFKRKICDITDRFRKHPEAMTTCSKTFKAIIRDINKICNEIIIYNKFWRKYYFALNYTLIPINLIFLQLIFFESDQIILRIMLAISCVCAIGAHIACNTVISSINRESKKSYKFLYELYFSCNSSLGIRIRIKV